MNTDNRIAEQIKKLRKQMGWSQTQLADKLSVSKQSISNWETGLKTPRMGALQNMADLFEVSIGYLTDGETAESQDVFENKQNSLISKTEAVMSQLNEMYQKRVYSYAKEQYENQSLAFPDTLAAHQADPNHIIDDVEAKRIEKYLDSKIDKFNGDK